MITFTGPYPMDWKAPQKGEVMSFDWPNRHTRTGRIGGPYLLFKSCGHFCYGMGLEPCCLCTGRIDPECVVCRPSGPMEGHHTPKVDS